MTINATSMTDLFQYLSNALEGRNAIFTITLTLSDLSNQTYTTTTVSVTVITNGRNKVYVVRQCVKLDKEMPAIGILNFIRQNISSHKFLP